MLPNAPSGNPTETTLAVKATDLATQFATKIEVFLASRKIQIEISDLVSWALPLISHAWLIIASVSATVLAIHLDKRRMLRQEIRGHSRAFYLTFHDRWVHLKGESSASLTDIFWSEDSAYVSLIKKGMKKTKPNNVVVGLDGPIYTEVIMSLLHAYYIDNRDADAKKESREILRTKKLPRPNPYIWALIHAPSYSRETWKLFQNWLLFRIRNWLLFRKWDLRTRTFTQLEYLRMPKSDYDKLKKVLYDLAQEQNKDIPSLLEEVSVNDSKYSEETIDIIFERLFGKQDVSPADARHIIQEKKRLLHIIHIIRYELLGGYIHDESIRWRQGQIDQNADQYGVS